MSRCTRRHSFNYHAYMVTAQDFELDIEVPAITTDDDASVRLLIAKVDGGEIGETYAGVWYYRLDVNGETVHHGDNLDTGTPKTHMQAARLAVDWFTIDWPEGSSMAERLDAFASSDSTDRTAEEN